MASLTLRLQLNLIFYDVKRILFYQKTLENRLFSFWKRKIQILMFCLGKNGFDVSIVSEIVNAVNDNDDHIVDLFFFRWLEQPLRVFYIRFYVAVQS